MRIYQEADYAAMSRRCANLISAEVIRKPDCVLGLATGSTPVEIYHQLAEWNRKGDLSFWDVITVNLDEYRGLAPTHTQSYRDFMQKNLFDHIDIRQENTYVPNGMAQDPEEECSRYDSMLRALGGTDLQLLGLGVLKGLIQAVQKALTVLGRETGQPVFQCEIQIPAAAAEFL